MNHRSFRRLNKILLLCALHLVLLGAASGQARAQAPQVTLEIQPESVELGAAESARVDVIVRNNSSMKIENLQIEPFSNEKLALAIAAAGDETLPPNSSTVWQLEVEQQESGLDSGQVSVTAEYTWQSADRLDELLHGGVVTADFQVNVPAVVDVASVASVEVKSTLTGLNEQRDGVVYLVANNDANVPIEITDIDMLSPEFVTLVEAESVSLPLTLAPNTSIVVPVNVEAASVVQPGKQLLVFTVEAAWQEEGRAQTGTLVTSHEVEVGVFGESVILTLLGIPAFFLLPGFLFLVSFKILWTWSGNSSESSILDIKSKPAEFLVSSITISLVAALLYPLLTSWLTGFQRNYLEAYGLNDLLYLWFVSILAGILAFIIAMTYRWLKRRYQEQRLKARTFVVGDEPLVVLQKLRKQGLTLALDAARYVHDEKEYRVRLLQAREETAEKYWIAPQICVANRAELSGEERSAVEEAINSKDIGGVLDLKHKIRLSWKVKEEQDLYWPPNASSPLQVEAAAIKGFVENASDEGLLLPEC